MARIKELQPAAMTAEQQEVYQAIASGPRGRVHGPLAVWLHRPKLADRAQALGRYCRYETSLPPRLSELAIIILGRIWGAEFEWWSHKRTALLAGISPAVVEAIRTHSQPAFEREDEAVVYAFVTTLHDRRSVPDEMYQKAVKFLGEEGVVDLVGIAGYYTLISMTIKVFEVMPPDGVARELDAPA